MRPRWPLSGRWLSHGRDACASRCGFQSCWRLPPGRYMYAIACSMRLPGCARLRPTPCASATGFIGVTGARFCPWPLPRLAPPRESSSPSCRPWPARETRYWLPPLWLISPACTRAAVHGNSGSRGRAPFPARSFWWACCLPRDACCLRGIGLTPSSRRVPRSGPFGFLPWPSPFWHGSIAAASRAGSQRMSSGKRNLAARRTFSALDTRIRQQLFMPAFCSHAEGWFLRLWAHRRIRVLLLCLPPGLPVRCCWRCSTAGVLI